MVESPVSTSRDPQDPGAATPSLALRAKQLASRARAKVDDEKATQEQSQTETALTKLRGELEQFEKALRTRRALTSAEVPVLDSPNLTKPLAELRTRVDEVGRPAPQFLNARSRDLEKLRSQLTQADAAAWQSWAKVELEKLPVSLLPRLGANSQATSARIDSLTNIARRPPNASDVKIFSLGLQGLREQFSTIEGSAVDALLARLSDGGVTLADLTEEEIALLREDHAVAHQIHLRMS